MSRKQTNLTGSDLKPEFADVDDFRAIRNSAAPLRVFTDISDRKLLRNVDTPNGANVTTPYYVYNLSNGCLK